LVVETEHVEYETNLRVTENATEFLAIGSSFVDEPCDDGAGTI
jgi:hypothetical protein